MDRILDNEFSQARRFRRSRGRKEPRSGAGLVATFLHSRQSVRPPHTDLEVLLGSVRPDKIELEKGLARWAQSSYWLDDLYTVVSEGQLPDTWRLGNRPNLTQMHAVAAKNIQDDIVRARLLDEIGKTKALTANASAAGVRVHTLPTRPKDIEDDGRLPLPCGAGRGIRVGQAKPGGHALLGRDQGADKPRVYRNARCW